MAYVKPTPADMKAAIPDFANDDNTYLQAYINQACLFVDESWLENDYQSAIIYLAAHLWALQKEAGVGSGGSSSSDDIDRDLYVKSVQVEDRTVTFGSRAELSKSSHGGMSVSNANLQQTSYGQLFYMLRKRNVAPIGVLNNV